MLEHASVIVRDGLSDTSQAHTSIALEESMATRSSVLSTLADIGDIVELPPGVAVSDLVRWAELKPGNASQMTVEELLHALQVVSLKTTVEWYVHHGSNCSM